jgi:hypothetical protein
MRRLLLLGLDRLAIFQPAKALIQREEVEQLRVAVLCRILSPLKALVHLGPQPHNVLVHLFEALVDMGKPKFHLLLERNNPLLQRSQIGRNQVLQELTYATYNLFIHDGISAQLA